MSEGKHYAEPENAGKVKKKKGKKTPLGVLLDAVGTIIMVACIIVCLLLAAPRFVGFKSYVVVSGSMEPSIPVGSLVYSREVDPATLETGDVIVFYSTNASSASGGNGAVPITHRVVENHKDKGELITKGDANENKDLAPTAYINVEGKVVFHVPKLGRLAVPFASLQGKLAAVLLILGGFLLTEAGNRLRR